MKDSGPVETVGSSELVERAISMHAVLSERAAAAEKARRISSETISDLVEAGFMRMLQPRRYGGYECDFPLMVDIGIELSRACASTGWNHAIIAVCSLIASHFPRETQDELWRDSPDTLVAASFIPSGVTRQVDGGYRLSGKWSFTSGCDNADWIALGARLPAENGGGERDRQENFAPRRRAPF